VAALELPDLRRAAGRPSRPAAAALGDRAQGAHQPLHRRDRGRPTTSLPERVGGGRNWDYRFSWLRDAALALRALQALGFTREVEGFARFLQRSAVGRAGDLQVLFGTQGVPPARADPGPPGGLPRLGAGADRQRRQPAAAAGRLRRAAAGGLAAGRACLA
jgi:hypothetical protein